MFVLDTNVVSEIRKANSGKADRNVVAWTKATPVKSLYISAISILELELGILQLERKDRSQSELLRTWLETKLMTAFEDRILSVDTNIARQCAALRIPDPRSERDALIAATAMVHGMGVATRNESNFEPTGVPILNPWKLNATENLNC